jgi:hypothetical protein
MDNPLTNRKENLRRMSWGFLGKMVSLVNSGIDPDLEEGEQRIN